jgi:pantothenate synthetase
MDTLEPVDTVAANNTLIAVAAFAGDTRLIDNVRL